MTSELTEKWIACFKLLWQAKSMTCNNSPPAAMTGDFFIHVKNNPDCRDIGESVYLTLEGGPFYHVGHSLLKRIFPPGERFVGGYKPGEIITLPNHLSLQVVQASFGAVTVMLPGLSASVISMLSPLLRLTSLGYRRMILKAVTWGLVDCSDGEIPDWRDLKWFKKSHSGIAKW